MAIGRGPYLPKPGWVKRWVTRGGALVSRSPETLIVIAATVVLGGLVHDMVFDIAYSAGGLISVAMVIASILTAPLFAIGIVWSMDAMRAADRGERAGYMALLPEIRDLLVGIFIINLLLNCVSLILTLPAELSLEKGHEALEVAAAGFEAHIRRGGMEIMSVLLPAALINPFALGGAVLARMGLTELKAHDQLISAKSPSVHLRLLIWVFIASWLPDNFPIFIQIPLILVILAAYYTGAREVILGEDENGEQETSRVTKSAFGT